jgi:hypothetical protein
MDGADNSRPFMEKSDWTQFLRPGTRWAMVDGSSKIQHPTKTHYAKCLHTRIQPKRLCLLFQWPSVSPKLSDTICRHNNIISYTIPYHTIPCHMIRHRKAFLRNLSFLRISQIQIGSLPRKDYRDASFTFLTIIVSIVPTDFVPKLGLPGLYQNLVHTTSTVTTVPSSVYNIITTYLHLG